MREGGRREGGREGGRSKPTHLEAEGGRLQTSSGREGCDRAWCEGGEGSGK